MPLVSVIVPVFNKANYLATALDSLLGQTLHDLEVICVDNNSTDGSRDVLETYAQSDKRIVVASECEGQGAGVARNVGLSLAKGDFVGFFDADDFLEPNMYESLASLAQDKDVDIALCGLDHFFPEHGAYLYPILPGFDGVKKSLDVGGRIFFLTNPSVCTKLFRRTFLEDEKLVFNAAMRTAEDMRFTYEGLMRARCIAMCNKTLYHYRQHVEGSLTNRNELRGVEVFDCFRYLETVIDDFEYESSYRVGLLNYVLEQTRYVLSVACDVAEYELRFSEFYKNWLPRLRVIEKEIYEEVYGLYERFSRVSQPVELLFIELQEKLDWLNDRDQQQERCDSSLKQQLKDARRVTDELTTSTTYKVGRCVMALPCRLRDVFSR